MKNWWKIQANRIDELSLRERFFLYLIVLGGLLVLADTLWLSPAQSRQKKIEASVKTQSAELQLLRDQLRVILLPSPATGDGLLAQSELRMLKGQMESVNRDIARLSASPGVDLPKALVFFLRQHDGLTLERTVTLAAEAGSAERLSMQTPVNAPGSLQQQGVKQKEPGYFKDAEALVAKILPLATPKDANISLAQMGAELKVPGSRQASDALPAKSVAMVTQETVISSLSRQGMELTVSGSYLELMRYVQTLEQSLPELRWGRMKLSSGKSSSQLTLQVFVVGGAS